jgi:hypothetical protein
MLAQSLLFQGVEPLKCELKCLWCLMLYLLFMFGCSMGSMVTLIVQLILMLQWLERAFERASSLFLISI